MLLIPGPVTRVRSRCRLCLRIMLGSRRRLGGNELLLVRVVLLVMMGRGLSLGLSLGVGLCVGLGLRMIVRDISLGRRRLLVRRVLSRRS